MRMADKGGFKMKIKKVKLQKWYRLSYDKPLKKVSETYKIVITNVSKKELNSVINLVGK